MSEGRKWEGEREIKEGGIRVCDINLPQFKQNQLGHGLS